jgi:hypothetical protein
MKRLNRRQAWLAVKKNFKDYEQRKNSVTYSAPSTTNGLCWAVDTMLWGDLISSRTANRMARDIKTQEPKKVFAPRFYWSLDAAGAKKRVRAVTRILKTIPE